MKNKLIAVAIAGLGLAACAPPASEPAKPEDPPVAETPAAPDRFANALTFKCEGGPSLDVLIDDGQRTAIVRADGGAAETLALDETATTGLVYKAGATSLAFDGPGATYTVNGAAKPCQFEAREIPAPKADGVVQTLTSADAGKSVEVKVGEKIAVALVGVPTAGYVWGASSPPAWITATDGPGGATSTAQLQPGFAGGSHWEVVIIEATATGEGEIVLAQRRPWETTVEPDATTFKFKLKAS